MEVSQKKALFVVTKSVWGGAQKYLLDLAANLPKETFQVMVAAGGRGPLASRCGEHGIPFHEIVNFQRDISVTKEWRAGIELSRLLFAYHPDVLHVSSPKAAGIAGVAAWCFRLLTFFKYSVTTVLTIHGWTFNETWRPYWQRLIIRLFSRATCFFYHRVIVISRADYHTALRHHIAPPKKLVFIPHGLDPAHYQFLARNEARAFLPPALRATFFLVGSIGEWTNNKGYGYLMEAAVRVIQKNPEVRFVLFGWGEQKQTLIDLIHRHNLAQHVFLIEGVSDAARFLKAFDLFVLPSLKEGLPYVLLEAQLAGVPIVATAVGGIPDIINNTNGILVPPARSDLLAEAILNPRLLPNTSPIRSLKEMIADTIRCYA